MSYGALALLGTFLLFFAFHEILENGVQKNLDFCTSRI